MDDDCDDWPVSIGRDPLPSLKEMLAKVSPIPSEVLPSPSLLEIDFIAEMKRCINLLKEVEEAKRPLYIHPDTHAAHVDADMERLAHCYGVRFVCDTNVTPGKVLMVEDKFWKGDCDAEGK